MATRRPTINWMLRARAATFLSRCLFNLNGLGGGARPTLSQALGLLIQNE